MLSKRERKKLRLEKLRKESAEAHAEHEQLQHLHQSFSAEQTHAKSRKHIFIYVTIIAAVLLGVSYAYFTFVAPGPIDGFAKCIAEKGAVMYGADFCKYTAEQRAMFGRSFKYVNYHDFSEGKDIDVTPTWDIGGKRYERVQALDTLAALTGCSING